MAYTTFDVVGAKAGNRLDVFSNVTVGSRVCVTPEPHNEYDPNAIAVHLGEKPLENNKIGYMPATIAKLFRLPGVLFGIVSAVRYAPDEALEDAGRACGATIAIKDLNYHRRTD